MVEYPCWVAGCEYKVEDAPHIDACVQSYREHFRGAHPTKYLNLRDVGQQAARYNLTFEEYMEQTLGNEWAAPEFRGDALYYVQSITRVRDGVPPAYRQSTIDAANAWLAANPAQGVADGAPARAPRFRPNRPRGVR